MTQKYQLTGMTCSGCEAKVKHILESIKHVISAEVSKDHQTAVIETEQVIPLEAFQNALNENDSKYQISEFKKDLTLDDKRSWWETYKPIVIIFFYISLVSLLSQVGKTEFHLMEFMRFFMAGFFLTFSFFKFLNLEGFAESYKMYDIIAKAIPVWAYLYAVIEFALGVSFLINYNPLISNIICLIVMSISIIGVLQSVLSKKKIQCACLGDVFNLPMSTVTIIEDGLMILMSIYMLVTMN